MGRVVVIGGGMAGTLAALAAREGGSGVTLLSKGPSATALSNGALDLPGPLLQLLPEELKWVQSRLHRLFEISREDALYATVLGTVRRAQWVGAAPAAGWLSPGRRLGVVSFRHHPLLLDAELLVDGLRSAGYLAELVVSDAFAWEQELVLSPFALAQRLDREEEILQLAKSLRGHLPPALDCLLWPPWIGLHRSTESLRALSAALGCPCAELLATTPSIPGARLQHGLDGLLQEAHIPVQVAEVLSLSRGHVRLQVEGRPGEVAFDRAVLATGRYLGGGLVRSSGLREPLLDLPIWDRRLQLADQPAERLIGGSFGAPAHFFRGGLRTDAELHPLDSEDRSLSWLLAAGAILEAGEDLRNDTLGWAAVTGLRAGRQAAREASGQVSEERQLR